MKKFTFIDLKKGRLDMASESDAKAVLYYFESNKERLAPFEPAKPDNFYSIEYWKNRIRENLLEFDSDKSLRLFIFGPQRNVIGTVNFTEFVRGPFQACYLGFSIDKEYEGTGLMREALNAGIAYIFNTLHFHRIMANHLPGNIKSARLLHKIGFYKEGYAKDYLFINGKWQDHVLTSRTAPS